ncbi:competence protein CoiA [Hanstruepera ponticola]|uniref:competence protein CoiA n=1 Tax=Hanstruepera ponticola TaxID=2042995 RepID=UPI0017849EDE|nr:competence protein CoiA family protein [Hanstruepera ponticola]
MRYAYNEKNDKIEVSFSGERAKCPDCDSIVIGKKGPFKIKHWSHKTKNECDSWYEPITEWHLNWQNLFPIQYREVSISKNGKTHRADLKLKNSLVIEIQNSPIKISEIEEREKFYGENNMIWILNGEKLARKSRITYKFNKKQFSLSFSIPAYSPLVSQYDMDEFKVTLFRNELLLGLKNDKNLINYRENNGNYFEYEFDTDKDFFEIDSELSYLFQKTCNELYDYNAYHKMFSDFNISFKNVKRDNYSQVKLNKLYWRSFIDNMSFPVFIDSLNGLESDLIYWYQENRIIKRSDFINKYLKYT